MEPQELAAAVLDGDRRAVARAISMVEDGAAGLEELSAALYPSTGRAWIVGLTGAPGAGKSTLTGRLVRTAREHHLSVAVLAIDPTSPFTGGALLGDRLRMQEHATDPQVFIRSMATRGHLGGLALAAPEAIRILDAAGRDLVIVETVGVGQVELDIATAADTTLVVLNPGWGDSIQVAKAGILEIADIYVINKADRDGTGKAVRDLETMLAMGPKRPWTPPVLPTTATEGDGIDALWDAMQGHRVALENDGELAKRRRARILSEVEEMVAQRMRSRVAAVLSAEADVVAQLESRTLDPYKAAGILMGRAN